MRRHILEAVLVIRPRLVALLPRRNMLQYQLGTLLQCLGRRDVAVEAECARGVVYCYEALPLLHCEGSGRIDAKADGFALRVKGIEIDVCDYAEGRLRTGRLELVEVFVGEVRFRDAARGCDGELRRVKLGGRRGHGGYLVKPGHDRVA